MCFGRIIMRLHDLLVLFAMQVARSLRIRSRYLAMPAGKARRTQAQLHAATRGNVRLHADTSLLPERSMYANPHSSDAHSPKQMTAASTAFRPAPAERNAEERSTLLTTLLRIHTTARRHCEAARRQQARVTAGGPSFDDRTRAGAEKFGPNQPPHRLHAPARSPPRHREVPEGGRTGGLHSAAEACGVPHTVQFMRKMQKNVIPRGVEPTPRVLKVYTLPTGPKHSWR